MRIIRRGSRGADVQDVQQRLIAFGLHVGAEDLGGRYGESTEDAVRSFQQRRSIPADGIVGPETWEQLVEAGYELGDRTLYLRYPYLRGDDVQELQAKLNALGFDAWREDGIFGEHVDSAVREFQRNTGREEDGIVGPDTVEALERLRPDPKAPSRALVREAESLRSTSGLAGTVVAVDAGHGGEDAGAVGPGGLRESEATFALVEALAQELRSGGARPRLLRTRNDNPSAGNRAKMANAMGAALCVSVHLNEGDAVAGGTTCSYFGTEATHSPAGLRLAEFLQKEVVAVTGLEDCRTNPTGIALLRETRMPAVQVEPLFITNEHEERLLERPGFAHDLAVAIAEAVQGFLETAQD